MTSLYPAETNSGVVTSWIPLTTAYTPPSQCSTVFRRNGPSYVAYDPGYGLEIDPTITCQPPAVTSWWEQGRLGTGSASGHTAVSLGPLTCPSGWRTVATSVKSEVSTGAMCCPPGFSLANAVTGSLVGDCHSDVSSGLLGIWAFTLNERATSSWSIVTTTVSEAVSTVGAIAVVGWNIRAVSPTIASTPTPALTPTSGSTGASISTTTSAPPPDQEAGLSSGASIGIGVGLASGILGAIALIFAGFLIRRKKKKNYWMGDEQQAIQNTASSVQVPHFKDSGPLQLHSDSRIELPDPDLHAPVELP